MLSSVAFVVRLHFFTPPRNSLFSYRRKTLIKLLGSKHECVVGPKGVFANIGEMAEVDTLAEEGIERSVRASYEHAYPSERGSVH